jgi:SAM-dependent methyltransferase
VQILIVTGKGLGLSMAAKQSKLGTLEHWDFTYSQELDNFTDHGDIGEIWFGTKAVSKMLEWINANNVSPTCSVLDVGCGNAHLLIELYKAGYKNSLGIDYSENAVSLAQVVSSKMNADISFKVLDFLKDSLNSKFDLILDKGTFDAISLSSTENFINEYLGQIGKHLNHDGVFLITSCNFNQSELESMFSPCLALYSTVKYPLFSFGGSVGSTIVTCAFKHSK